MIKSKGKHIEYYHDNYVGDDILRKAKEMIKPNTEYKWDYYQTYKFPFRAPKENEDSRVIHYSENTQSLIDKYEDLGIDFMLDKDDLKMKLSKYDPDFWKRHNLDDYWEQYLERDKLIRAGLYEKARQELYTEHYMATAAQYMGNNEGFDEITKNLSKLTPEQFLAVTKPSPNRDRTTSALPSIAELYQLKGMYTGSKDYEDLLSRFKTAFREAGIEWNDFTNKKVFADIDYEVKNQTFSDKYVRAFRSQYTFSTSKDREAIRAAKYTIQNSFDARKALFDLLKKRMESLADRGKTLIKVNKKGGLYIRGISRSVTADFIEYLANEE